MKTYREICRVLRAAAVLLTVACAAACAKHRIIPDRVLADIFHDAFLTNAYIENKGLRTDSLNIYEPVFARYGYTSEDVQYTIGNFSKRKSARLGDVVEEAIKRLEEEGKIYEAENVVLDTIDNIARRRFSRTLYSDSLVRMQRLRDSSKLKITLGDIRPGEYRISYEYVVDSLDDNISRRSIFAFERADSTVTGRQQHSLRKTSEPEKVTRTLTADTSARRLTINLMEVTPSRNDKIQHHTGITVRDLRIVFVPNAAEAVDSLYNSQLVINIFADEFYDIFPRDSVASGAAPLRDSL